MKDLGAARIFVGIEIIRNRIQRTIALQQNRYITNILKLFRMHEANGISTPLEPKSRLCSSSGNFTKSGDVMDSSNSEKISRLYEIRQFRKIW